MRQLRGGSAGVLGNYLLQNAFDLVGTAQATFDVGQLVQGIRHFAVLGIRLADLGKRLSCTLQVALGQVHLTQPVLRVAGILAVRVFAQEGGKRLAGLVEVLLLDQVESSIIVELFFRRISRLATRGRLLRSSASGAGCCTGSGIGCATG